MRKMIASLLVAAFAIALAGSAFANGGCLHGSGASAESAVPATVAGAALCAAAPLPCRQPPFAKAEPAKAMAKAATSRLAIILRMTPSPKGSGGTLIDPGTRCRADYPPDPVAGGLTGAVVAVPAGAVAGSGAGVGTGAVVPVTAVKAGGFTVPYFFA